jgi:serine phosphatase RsbU (regulator of sigma subunit)/anti-sigma regulatory factor (Ser/Thr protein kinase)
MEPNGETLRARVAKGIEEEVEQGVRIPVGQGFAGRIVAERRAVFIADVDHADILNPILREKGIRSLLGVPLLVEGRALGVLHVGSLTPRAFSAEERDLLQLAADRAAIAIEHAQLYEQRHLAETLQRRLLPDDLPAVVGLEVETRYLPASGETLGGDWYDTFTLGGGRIVVAVGDVVGHGVLAAAVMAQLRTALRAYAIDGHAPAAVVDRVNRLMFGLGPSAMTTLAYAVIDPELETLELVNAGHPPPLVVTEGEAVELPLQGNMALGASELARYRSEVHSFEAGAALVLYTDGLVERRGHSIEDGLRALREEAAAFGPHANLCGHLVDRLVPRQRRDDIALLVARVTPVEERLTGTWPASRNSLAPVRRLLRRWLRARGATEEETYDVTVACQEACANAIEHAYRPSTETFELDVRDVGAGAVRVTVRDHGQWRSPRGTNRGRGLVLMRALMESVDVQHDESGTTVVLERQLACGVPA